MRSLLPFRRQFTRTQEDFDHDEDSTEENQRQLSMTANASERYYSGIVIVYAHRRGKIAEEVMLDAAPEEMKAFGTWLMSINQSTQRQITYPDNLAPAPFDYFLNVFEIILDETMTEYRFQVREQTLTLCCCIEDVASLGRNLISMATTVETAPFALHNHYEHIPEVDDFVAADSVHVITAVSKQGGRFRE